MKQLLSLAAVVTLSAIVLVSCSKKSSPAPSTTNLPAQVTSLVSTAVLDSMQKNGAVINKGITPPTVAGIFLIHPDVCTFDNSGSNYAGKTFDDYKYKFSGQNNAAFAIRVDYIDTNFPSAVLSDSTATVISGHDNLFTVYAKVNASRNGVNFVILHVLSGEVVSGAIKNFQNSTCILSKDADPNGYAEPTGAIRVFYDSDLVSEAQTTFNMQ